MKVAVVGCGIAGLTASILLKRLNIDAYLFDQFEKPEPLGSGLVIQPVGQKVLGHLDLLEKVIAKGAKGYRMIGFEAHSKRKVLNVNYGGNGTDSFGLGIHRSSLFNILLGAARHAQVTFKTSAKVIDAPLNGNQRYLIMEGGQNTAPFDLIIDASGANSRLSPLQGKPLGYGAVWGTVNWPENTNLRYDQLEQRYRKARKMIGILPIGTLENDSQKKAAMFWSLPAEKYDNWKNCKIESWQDEAVNLWPEVEPFISQITKHKQMTFAQYTHGTLRMPFQTAMVHIGDAAHRTSPQLGQGANMALLDAFALAQALNTTSIAQALPLYYKSRKRHQNLYQAMSWAFTPMYQSNSNILPFLRDWIAAPISGFGPTPAILSRLVNGNLCQPIRNHTF